METAAQATQKKGSAPAGAPHRSGPAPAWSGSRPARSDGQGARQDGLRETVVTINRVSKVVKGGKRFSFAALVVVGDGAGSVGFGLGKAKDVQGAIRKGNAQAVKAMTKFPLQDGTVPHEITAKFRSAKVWMRPAAPGTGVIAGASVRAVLEAGGVRNVLTKSLGSTNPYNVIGATLECLGAMRTRDQIDKLRGR